MNHAAQGVMTKVGEACGDDAAVLALAVVRMVAAGYSTGDVACWDLAFANAERLLPPETAGRFVGCFMSLVRSVRACRLSEWCFMPATCCRVTRDERCLLALLAAARDGDPAATARMVGSVVGSAPSRQVETAVRVAASAMEEVSQTLAATAERGPRPSAALH